MNYSWFCVLQSLNTSNSVTRGVWCLRNVYYRCYSSAGGFSRQKWYAPGDVATMSRRELQEWCKKLRIRANTSTIQLRSDLLDYHRNTLSKSAILNYPFFPMHTPSQTISINAPLCTPESHLEKRLFDYRMSDGVPSNLIDSSSCLPALRHFRSLSCDLPETAEGVVNAMATIGLDKVPSVSKILRATTPKGRLFALSHWTKKQKALLGEEGFRQEMNKIRKNGIEFHRFVHQCLAKRSLNTQGPGTLQGFIESTKQVFGKLGDAIGSEQSVSHLDLGYKGRVDMLACYEGNPCVIEWKTSQKKKPRLEDCGDYPMQVMAYAGAINSGSSFGFKVKHGLIVIAYEDGTPADVHCLDLSLCSDIWEKWLLRIHQFYQMNVNE